MIYIYSVNYVTETTNKYRNPLSFPFKKTLEAAGSVVMQNDTQQQGVGKIYKGILEDTC